MEKERKFKMKITEYLTKDKIINKLIPKLVYYNEEYKLSQDDLLKHIGNTIINSNSLDDLLKNPVLYISLDISLGNKIE